MSYVTNRSALGLSTEKVKKYIQTGTEALKAGQKILEDPALPEVTKLVLKLNEIEQRTAPSTKRGVIVPGIGLKDVVKPLKAYVYTKEHPWVKWAVLGAVFAVPFMLGRMSKRR